MDLNERLDQLRELYEQLPEIDCQGKCANSCGPIDMSEAEHQNIINLGVLIPTYTQEAHQRWSNNEPLHCPALNRRTLDCDVYEDRPLICRAWGVAESMPCTYGCKPTRYLTDREMYTLLLKSFEIGGHRHGAQGEDYKVMLDMLDDPRIEPLMARFIRGDTTVEVALAQEIFRFRTERGL